MASRLIGNLIGCQGLVRASQLIRTGEIYDQLPDLCRRCGIDGLPSIAISTEVLTPVVVGIVRPCILLPSALISGLTPKQIEVILLHELMHIRRLDQWVLLWQAALETLLFYHPTVWVINRQLNESREHCCDDQVVQLGIQPIDYVRALFEVAENTILSTNRGVSKGRWQTDWQSLASQMTGRNTPSSAN